MSSGSTYAPLAASGLGASGLLSRLLEGADGLDSLLEPALGPVPRSPLAASGSGPTSFLSQVLGVADEIDSLVRAALDGAQETSSTSHGDERVESVLYTVRSDDSEPSDPRIVVEAEVVHDSAFEGQPSLQVRFVGSAEPEDVPALDRPRQPSARSPLGYRPSWTPVLVRTPPDLAEQMRVRWREAMEELQRGGDPRMATFLAGFAGTELALAVLNSSQSATSKFVLLQGLMDPDSVRQFQGLGLDAGTFAYQIRIASEGDKDALSWLEDIQREGVLTSLAEVTGIDLAAEADFRLSRWHQQGNALIEAVTTSAQDADFGFSTIRWRAKRRAEEDAHREKMGARDAASGASAWLLDRWESEDYFYSSAGYGLLEDWFFEETQAYLTARFRQSLPAQFIAALMPASGDRGVQAALAEEVRRLAGESSTDLNDYVEEPAPVPRSVANSARLQPWRTSSETDWSPQRIGRIVQGVGHVITCLETAGDDDLGTLVVAHEVLAYAQWRRDGIRAARQAIEAERHKAAAVERASQAQRRSNEASQRDEEARKVLDLARNIEGLVERYAEALSRTTRSIAIQDPLTDSFQSAASARLEQAKAREVEAGEWLAAAEERERWSTAEAAVAATPSVEERLRAERGAAIQEQSEAKTERQAARDEQQVAEDDIAGIAEARSRFADLIRPLREENRKREEAEAEHRRQEMARQDEERRLRAEAQQKQWAAEREQQEAADQRQEEVNQRQQERARLAKDAIAPALERLIGLPDSASVWRRKSLAATRASLEQTILKLQAEIVGPLVPPRTRSKAWPNLLCQSERYLGTVKKVTDYGAFVSLPGPADGLVRASNASISFSLGQLVIVEIADLPYGKPIVLKLVSR